jgi:hypothetical protein
MAFIVLGLLSGCEGAHDSSDAQQLATQYMQRIQAGDFAQAAQLYPEDMRRNWKDFLQQGEAKYGALRSYKFTGVEVNTVYSGKYYLFNVDAEYANASTMEVLTLFKNVSDNHFFIVSHKISAG